MNKIMVRAVNTDFGFIEYLEDSMVKKLASAGVNASSFIESFPPTREWTDKEIVSSLVKNGYDSIMFISFGGSDSSSQTLGYMNNGSAYSYGGTTSFSSTSTPIIGFKRSTSTRIHIFDVKSGDKVWIGDTRTKAGGALYMGDTTTTNDIATEGVDELKDSGHI